MIIIMNFNVIVFCGGFFSINVIDIILSKGIRITKIVYSYKSDLSYLEGAPICFLLKKYNISLCKQSELTGDEYCDYIISYGYKWKIKQANLALANRLAVNFHPAPLPQFAGWAFSSIAVLEEASTFGSTCHVMNEEFDAGPIIYRDEFDYNHKIHTGFSLEYHTQLRMLKLLVRFCDDILMGKNISYTRQNYAQRRFLNKSEFDQIRIIPSDSNYENIQRYARSFWFPPYEGAILKHNNYYIEIIPNIIKEQFKYFFYEKK